MKPANYAPVYAATLYPQLAETFRSKGWALAVHGSMARDFDLIAVPWDKNPYSPQHCVDAVTQYFAIKEVGKPETKLHGRLVYTLALAFGEAFIDLSFMPRTEKGFENETD